MVEIIPGSRTFRVARHFARLYLPAGSYTPVLRARPLGSFLNSIEFYAERRAASRPRQCSEPFGAASPRLRSAGCFRSSQGCGGPG